MSKDIKVPMDVDIAQGGTLRVKLHFNPAFAPRFNAGLHALQKEFDAEIIRKLDPYVPFLTGALKGSAHIHTVLGSGKIVYATPYARYQYYLHPIGTDIRDGVRGSYWGERGIDANKMALANFLRARAKEHLK